MTLIRPVVSPEMSHEQIHDTYQNHWQQRQTQAQTNYNWFKERLKHLGYKSIAQFVRETNYPVTSGTLANYIRGYVPIPMYQINTLCHTLKLTPNVLLSELGYYDPRGQEIVPL